MVHPQLVYVFHMLLVSPLLYYISYTEGQVDPRLYKILKWIALGVFMYHGLKLYKIRKVLKK